MSKTENPDQQFGKELLQNVLTGGGLTASAAALYHLIHGAQTAELPELNTRLSSGAVPTKKKKRLGTVAPSSATAYLLNTYKRANADASTATNKFQEMIGQLVGQARPPVPFPFTAGMADRSWKTIAGLGAAGLGAYGGLKTVNSIADEKRKDELSDSIDAARKEYFDALTGKNEKTAWLQEAFDNYMRKPVESSAADWVLTPTLLATLGSAAVGGSYMYNHTKARTRAENLRRAAAARARLQSLQQTPWVDPAELAALTRK
jgi:hypothetical protein